MVCLARGGSGACTTDRVMVSDSGVLILIYSDDTACWGAKFFHAFVMKVLHMMWSTCWVICAHLSLSHSTVVVSGLSKFLLETPEKLSGAKLKISF
jgi:hypothetical protein